MSARADVRWVMTTAAASSPRTYEVRTYGCQMNVHDSERLTGLLEARRLRRRAADGEQADVVVFNTCAVRENADNKLYGNLGAPARRSKAEHPGHADRRRRLPRPEGPRRRSSARRPGSTSSSAPTTSARCRRCWSAPGTTAEAQVEILESLDVFPSTLPTRRESAYAGWVSISVGLQQHLHVLHRPGAARQGEGPPARRHPRRGRGAGRRGRRSRSPCSGRTSTPTASSSATGSAFGKLLRACGEIDGLERVRFTSPHPAEFTDDVIDAMAETPERDAARCTCRCSPAPTDVLKAMRRSYRSEKYLGIIERVRAAMPDAAITTDIIVGFPGETEEDFAATLDVVARGRASPRRSPSSTPSAPARRPRRMPDQVPSRRSSRSATSG